MPNTPIGGRLAGAIRGGRPSKRRNPCRLDESTRVREPFFSSGGGRSAAAPGVRAVLVGQVEDASAGLAEGDVGAVEELVEALGGEGDVAAGARGQLGLGLVVGRGHGVGAVLLDGAAVALAQVLRDDRLG